jgi:mono/diheme cytochrome c family protein
MRDCPGVAARVVGAVILWCGAVAGTAPAANAVEPTLCRWTSSPPAIDGRGDDPAWTKAAAAPPFALPWLGEKNRPADMQTKLKLLWDRGYLYFLAEMEDRDLWADITEQDGRCWENDVFELFFKPSREHKGYYEFQVTPRGTRLDMFIPKRDGDLFEANRSKGPFFWETKISLNGTLNERTDKDEGWTVEGRIPWTDLLRTGGRPAAGETWHYAGCRYDYVLGREPELSTCAPLASEKQANFHKHEDYAPILFAGPEDLPTLWNRQPLTTSRLQGTPEPPPPYRVKRMYPDLKLSLPLGMAMQPGSDRMLFWCQGADGAGGKLLRGVDTPDLKELETLFEADKDRILFDLCFHPRFTENGFLYIGSNGKGGEGFTGKTTRLTRYRLNPLPPFEFDPKSELVILEWASDGHNGGALRFGPDGYLYMTSGDGTSDSDPDLAGQDMSKLLAKLLRLDVDHPEKLADGTTRPYSVPKDNPFVGREGIRPETWAYGFRNPWRMTIDPKTGHVWVGNNGQDLWEQVYFVRKGDNFGWSVMEGSHVFYAERKPGPTPFTKPALEHSHAEARSLTGGVAYHGKQLESLRGMYIYGDYSTGKIWGARHDGTQVTQHQELADTALQLVYFNENSRGELLLMDYQGSDKGGLYTLEPAPAGTEVPPFPKTLSETGLFKQVPGHELVDAFLPYDVNVPFWSDGAVKHRWFALTGTDTTIDATREGGWKFPDDSVIVKSFQLETKPGDAASRKWIETRIMVKRQGEWTGYTYEWNDAQTEGTLVDANGKDKPFALAASTDGSQPERTQTWRYPSRAECMVCHSRAANYVLGLCTVQQNRERDYSFGRASQLEVYERAGLIKFDAAEQAKDALRERLTRMGTVHEKLDDALKELAPQGGQRGPSWGAWLGANAADLPRLVDPFDTSRDLAVRAKSFLHANCASCHVMAGGGNAQMDLAWHAAPDKVKVVGAKPVHALPGIEDARIVAPGSPDRSVMWKRLSLRGRGQMPPIGSNEIDAAGRDLIRQWIESLRRETAAVSAR